MIDFKTIIYLVLISLLLTHIILTLIPKSYEDYDAEQVAEWRSNVCSELVALVGSALKASLEDSMINYYAMDANVTMAELIIDDTLYTFHFYWNKHKIKMTCVTDEMKVRERTVFFFNGTLPKKKLIDFCIKSSEDSVALKKKVLRVCTEAFIKAAKEPELKGTVTIPDEEKNILVSNLLKIARHAYENKNDKELVEYCKFLLKYCSDNPMIKTILEVMHRGDE